MGPWEWRNLSLGQSIGPAQTRELGVAETHHQMATRIGRMVLVHGTHRNFKFEIPVNPVGIQATTAGREDKHL